MLKLLKYAKPFLALFFLMLVFVYGQAAANLALPDYMAKIVNEGIVTENTSLIYQNGWIMLLVALVGGLCTVVVSFLAARIAAGFTQRLREQVFTRVESFSLAEFNTFSTASLITRCTNDVQQIQNVTVMTLRMAFMAPFIGLGAIVKAYNLAPNMSWIMAVAVLTLVSIIAVTSSIAIPTFRKIQKVLDKLNLVTREILTGLRVIRAFNTEKHEEKKFASVNAEVTQLNLLANRLMLILQPAMTLIMGLSVIAIVWFGAQNIRDNTLQVGDLLAFMQYSMQAIFAFLMISIVFILVPRASVSAQRIVEILEAKPTITDPAQPQRTTQRNGKVEFKNVSFTYRGAEEAVVKNISFEATPGQTTAIVGSTGSGKSTLIHLIPRFYDVTEGSVEVDGCDIRQLTQSDLHNKIGYVPQKPSLFSGTIRSSILYGAPHLKEEEVEKAASIAQATEFISGLDEKFNSPVAQAGNNLSGGQKQRISIARALAKKPEIYIFDDSFSALDFKTDAELRKALRKETKGKTVIIVAQRISTVMHADKILVLDAGSLVGQGTHSELLESCEVYREIATSQLSEEELAKEFKRKVKPELSGEAL